MVFRFELSVLTSTRPFGALNGFAIRMEAAHACTEWNRQSGESRILCGSS